MAGRINAMHDRDPVADYLRSILPLALLRWKVRVDLTYEGRDEFNKL